MSSDNILSHSKSTDLTAIVAAIKNKITQQAALTEKEKQEIVGVLDEMTKFPMGRFLLLNRGFDGYWTHQMVYEHPRRQRFDRDNYLRSLTSLEQQCLNAFPTVIATQERFTIFQKILKALMRVDVRACSLPCGLMADLLTLENLPKSFSFVGVDIDENSIIHARRFADSCGIQNVDFIVSDAWKFEDPKGFDVVVSNGLNIYVQDQDAELRLYKNFHRLLRRNGSLIISFLTPPPTVGSLLEWKMAEIDITALRLQKIVFSDVLGAKWQNFHSSDEMLNLLQLAGFTKMQIHWDRQHIFPTIHAVV
jgi:SAM-dependent methyltransferase